MSVAEAPLQTNASDPAQVESAETQESLGKRQAAADVRAEIADYNARRRCWPVVKAAIGDFLLSADNEACREYVVEQRMHKQRVAAWMQHRELFLQMVEEGMKRDADEQTNRPARRAK